MSFPSLLGTQLNKLISNLIEEKKIKKKENKRKQ